MSQAPLVFDTSMSLLTPFLFTTGVFVTVGILGTALSMRWLVGREAWRGECPRHGLAAAIFVVFVLVLPALSWFVWQPEQFIELHARHGMLHFDHVIGAREVHVDDLHKVEILPDERMAFWFAEHEGDGRQDEKEVTSAISPNDQDKHLEQVQTFLRKAGWKGEVTRP